MNKKSPSPKDEKKQGPDTFEQPPLEWIEKAKNGNADCFEKLLEMYRPLISSVLHSYAPDLSPSDEDDLRQELILSFYRAVCSYDLTQDQVSLGLYAKTCMKNRIYSYFRKTANRPTQVPLEEMPVRSGREEEPIHRIIEEENFDTLRLLINTSLSPYEKQVWWLFASGFSVPAIAKKIGKDRKSVENAVYRIRRRLREILEEP